MQTRIGVQRRKPPRIVNSGEFVQVARYDVDRAGGAPHDVFPTCSGMNSHDAVYQVVWRLIQGDFLATFMRIAFGGQRE